MSASETVRRHTFGAPPDPADAADEVLRKIHELSKPAAPAGMRGITPREREIYLAALESYETDLKEKKALLARAESAEQQLAKSKTAPVAALVSYRGTVTSRDAAGDMRRIELVPSSPDGMPYRVNITGRDAAGNLRAFELVPGKRMPT